MYAFVAATESDAGGVLRAIAYVAVICAVILALSWATGTIFIEKPDDELDAAPVVSASPPAVNGRPSCCDIAKSMTHTLVWRHHEWNIAVRLVPRDMPAQPVEMVATHCPFCGAKLPQLPLGPVAPERLATRGAFFGDAHRK